MAGTQESYRKRINAVIQHIEMNLDRTFSLDELANIANFSSYHFHRIFVAIMGESVNFYTNRIRLEKAARLLRFSANPISEIAFACGFSSPATFSRSFKQYFSTTPNKYRKEGEIKDSKICKELFPMDAYIVDMPLEEKMERFPVTIKELPERKVAYIRILDSYREGVVLEAFENLVDWAKENNIYENGQFFGMSLDDPMVTPKEKYRYEACLLIPKGSNIIDSSEIEIMQMPNCKYATTIVSGDISLVATATSFLFNDWLLNSQYEPEHLHGLEYFLDRENICNWEHFDLELYIPIKFITPYS